MAYRKSSIRIYYYRKIGLYSKKFLMSTENNFEFQVKNRFVIIGDLDFINNYVTSISPISITNYDTVAKMQNIEDIIITFGDEINDNETKKFIDNFINSKKILPLNFGIIPCEETGKANVGFNINGSLKQIIYSDFKFDSSNISEISFIINVKEVSLIFNDK